MRGLLFMFWEFWALLFLGLFGVWKIVEIVLWLLKNISITVGS